MSSTDPEIKDGFPLPIWMKNKPTREFEPFAASPPAADDSFFYIRYPKKDLLFGKNPVDQNPPKINTEQAKELNAAGYKPGREQDWSKHTKPCQDVIHGIAPINTAVAKSVSLKPKPAGTDDGFKGEGAACGTSVLKVATQMISSTRSPRGFTVASPSEDPAEPPPESYALASRRGSKSLPVTPAHSPRGSPTSRRKQGNRYFTSPFEPVGDGSTRSWLTAALLGFKKDLTTSTSTLAEEDALETRLQGSSLAESVENLGPSPKSKDSNLISNEPSTSKPSQVTKASQTFKPKPTEFREMNFWSPTSM